MWIRAIRKEKKMTQKQLALLAEVSQGKISEYESGKVIPRIDTGFKIASALECTMEELLNGKRGKSSV